MKRLTLIPAYGRDYKSKAEVSADFEAGKDFYISDMSSRYDGSLVNKADLIGDGVTEVHIRYKKLRQVAVLKVEAKQNAGGVS